MAMTYMKQHQLFRDNANNEDIGLYVFTSSHDYHHNMHAYMLISGMTISIPFRCLMSAFMLTIFSVSITIT